MRPQFLEYGNPVAPRPMSFALCLAALTFGACGSGEQKEAADAAVGESLVVQAVTPSEGPLPGGSRVTITGEGFDQDSISVVIGGREASNVEIVDDGSITLDTPEGPFPGLVDVVVFGPQGYGSASQAYTYFPPPTLESIEPQNALPGTTVNITGSGFTNNDAGDAIINIGDTECAQVNIVSDGEATCVVGTSAEPFISQNIVFENNNGSASGLSFVTEAQGLMVIFDNAAASNLGFIDPSDPESYRTIRILEDDVQSLLRLPDGNFVARVNGTFGFYNPYTGAFEPRFSANSTTDLALVGGKLYAGARRSNAVRELDLETNTSTTITLTSTLEGVRGIASSPSPNHMLVAGKENENVFVFDMESTVLVDTFGAGSTSAPGIIRSLARLENVVYALYLLDGRIRGGATALQRLNPNTGIPEAVAPLPDGAHRIIPIN